MNIKLNIIVQKDDNWFVAKCIENNIASQGKTIDESLINLKEALELYYENEKPEEIENKQTFLTTMEVAV
jgi:predicted RNase H-like HicB family nuclease